MSANRDGGDAIGRRMVHGAAWMVAMRWLVRLIGLLNTVIIARLLHPEDFGLIALAMIGVNLAISIGDGDIEMALVRDPAADREAFATGWTLKILIGLITCVALWMVAAPIAAWFGDARIAAIVQIAALRPLILGAENIRTVEFRRDLRFDAEFRYLVGQRLLGFAGCLILVFALGDYRALAWAGPLSAGLTVALSYLVLPARPRLSLARWRALWGFSRWQMLFNAGRLVGENGDQFLIGRLASAELTGLYVVGFDLAVMPTREVMLPAGRALMPGYARFASSDPDRMRAAFARVIGLAALLAAALGVGISSVAADAVVVVLGERWAAAAPFVASLGLFGALEGLWLMLDPFLIATGRERLLALANLALSLLLVAAVAAAALHLGVAAIPSARVGVMAVMLAVLLAYLVALRILSLRALVGALWRPVLAAVAMALGLAAARLDGVPPALSLLHDVVLGAGIYLAAVAGLWCAAGRPDGAERDLIRWVTHRFGRDAAGN